MPNLPPMLTKKIGPLPLWGWGVAIGGAGLAFKMMRGKSSTPAAAAPVEMIPTAYAGGEPQVGYLEGLSNQLFDVQTGVDDLLNRESEITPPPDVQVKPPWILPGPIPPVQLPPLPPVIPPSWNPGVIGWPTSWPAYARNTLASAREYAMNIFANYSPGGAFYGQGIVGAPHTIPIIPTEVISQSEQQALATQYGGTLLSAKPS